MKFAHILGKINSTIILSILFIFIIGIYALIFKIIRFFRYLFHKDPDSYWIEKTEELDLESLKHPF